ncbi:MAG: CAP domain-containing protein, partial [Leptospira sp.]|nr:CAP domain-containing protein [Leptospira sp.]
QKLPSDAGLFVLASIIQQNAASSVMNRNAKDFFDILVSYRANGSYTLDDGTVRSFLDNSRCSGTTNVHVALIRAAQKHTENMIRQNFFSHTGPDGSSPSDRVRAEGLNVGAGENIAAGLESAEATFNQWWNSSGHRANMENCNYTHVGIGYANRADINPNANFRHYWTNKFSTIR